VRYIFNTNHQYITTSIRKFSFTLVAFLTSCLFYSSGCSKNETISEVITETNFVTKKDAYLYEDIIEKTIIDEIPAFVKIKATEKMILIISGSNNKTYYKTSFNNNNGWVESIYLAILDQDKQSSETTYHPPQPIEETQNTDKPISTKKPIIKTTWNKNNVNYFIQIATFKNKENAKKLLGKMNILGVSLSIEKTGTSSSTLFRLVSNIYQNKSKAKNSLELIKAKYPSLAPIIITNKRNNILKRNQISKNSKIGKTEYYTIQISSFKNKKAALKLSKKMTEAGYKSKVTEAWVKGETWFRVQHGEYKMKAVAKQVSNKIKNTYKFDPWISNIYK